MKSRHSGGYPKSQDVSRLELLLEALTAQVRLMLDSQRKQMLELNTIRARIERIERAQAIPLHYSLREACRRLGISESTGYKHPERLPMPVEGARLPLRYRVEDIETLAEASRQEMAL